ncbi:hypothetical protein QOZ95_000385 [Paenibacillus brasilensis]|uniref:Uncharacterized protein n=1 Tax=Paenibacillus brasilensis TaxID=128574 RepID=A0ABU0KS19_9BACL|nr:hypothetical protein [Paenibacillus brasilensis]
MNHRGLYRRDRPVIAVMFTDSIDPVAFLCKRVGGKADSSAFSRAVELVPIKS